MSVRALRRGSIAASRAGTPSLPSVSGLFAQFDASQIPGLADNDPVATWSDLSGSGRDATQATSGSRPLYKTGITNGRPVVRFDGTDDKLATSSFASQAQPNTILVVANVTSTATFQNIFDGITSTDRHTLGMGVITSGQMGMWAGNTQPSAAQSLPTGWHVWACTYNVTSSTLYKDGGFFASGGSAGATNALTGITLGGRWTTGETLGGDIAEYLLYDTGLSTGDRQLLEAYLKSKWGTP